MNTTPPPVLTRNQQTEADRIRILVTRTTHARLKANSAKARKPLIEYMDDLSKIKL